MSEGPYTTISVDEFNRLTGVIQNLRWRLQKIRELLESGDAGAIGRALEIVKVEDDAL